MHVGVGEVLIGSLFFIYYFIEKARGTPKLTLGGGEDQAAQEEAKTKPKARSRSSRSRIAHHCCAALHGDEERSRKMRSGSGEWGRGQAQQADSLGLLRSAANICRCIFPGLCPVCGFKLWLRRIFPIIQYNSG